MPNRDRYSFSFVGTGDLELSLGDQVVLTAVDGAVTNSMAANRTSVVTRSIRYSPMIISMLNEIGDTKKCRGAGVPAMKNRRKAEKVDCWSAGSFLATYDRC